MSNVKEIERAELHKTIWRIANDLRGSVDGWDFKSYVLGMLFYRFISENLAAYLNDQERRAGGTIWAQPRGAARADRMGISVCHHWCWSSTTTQRPSS